MLARRWIVAIALAALAGMAWWLVRVRRDTVPPPRPPTARERVGMVPPTPTPTFTAPPESPEQQHSTVVLPWNVEPTPSPSPSPVQEVATARPGPSPTPDVSECVNATFSASMAIGAPGRVMVDIVATNRCGRELAPLEVWFWVAGFREGQLIQAVRGHPFDPIPSYGEEDVHIALPGSIDWYDRIEVRVLRTEEL